MTNGIMEDMEVVERHLEKVVIINGDIQEHWVDANDNTEIIEIKGSPLKMADYLYID